jgi:DNA replication protein
MTTEAEPEGASIKVATELFTEMLPRVSDLAELKAVLMVSYLGARQASPGVSLAQMAEPGVARVILGMGSPEPSELLLQRVIDRAVANGSLLRLRYDQGSRQTSFLFPVSESNRRRLKRLRQADGAAAEVLGVPADADVVVYRANAFSLYEQHIGPLTPLLAERLRDAEKSFPRAWLEEAILTAASYDKRSWRYIETILNRWQETGGPDVTAGRRA